MLLWKIMFYCQACFEFNTSLRYERKYKIRNIKFSRKKQWAFTTMKIRRLVVKFDTEWDFLEWGNKIINTGNKRKERKVRPAFMQKEDCRLLRYSNTWLLWDTIVQIRNKDTHFNWLDWLITNTYWMFNQSNNLNIVFKRTSLYSSYTHSGYPTSKKYSKVSKRYLMQNLFRPPIVINVRYLCWKN